VPPTLTLPRKGGGKQINAMRYHAQNRRQAQQTARSGQSPFSAAASDTGPLGPSASWSGGTTAATSSGPTDSRRQNATTFGRSAANGCTQARGASSGRSGGRPASSRACRQPAVAANR